MPIKYQSIDGLTERQRTEGIRILRSATITRIGDGDLKRQIIAQGTTARPADIDSVIENFGTAVKTLCARGESITIKGLGIITPRVCGTRDADGNWLDGPHTYLTMRFDPALHKEFRAVATIEEVPAVKTVPVIRQFIDNASGTKNSKLTPGAIAEVQGENLRFDPTKSDEGLWLLPQNGGTPVKAALFNTIKPVRLVFQPPAGLELGTGYRLQVKARIRGTKTLRETVSDFVLAVE